MDRVTQVGVFDVDGNLTFAEIEGRAFLLLYTRDLPGLLKQPPWIVYRLIREATAAIAANPGRGTRNNGRIVAPSVVDPYLRMKAIAEYLLDHFGLIPDPEERYVVLDAIFAKRYMSGKTAFRPFAREALLAAANTPGMVVFPVTNSRTNHVKAKLTMLAQGNAQLLAVADNTIGDAKKLMVPEASEGEPLFWIPGLERAVIVTRLYYFQILNDLREHFRLEWKDLIVFGDIFELDLAMPWWLGCRIVLMANEFTPKYEKAFVLANAPRARLITSLEEVPDCLRR